MKNLSEQVGVYRRPNTKLQYPLIPIGTVFGYWVVIENGLFREYRGNHRRHCRVRCRCGTEAISADSHLRSGKSRSCGCRRHENRGSPAKHPLIPIGTRFDRLSILENDVVHQTKSGKIQRRACRVRCQCGTEFTCTSTHLRSGATTSCGCKWTERDTDTLWRSILASTRSRAKQYGREFHLTLSQLKAVSLLPCVYCGKEPANLFRLRRMVDGVYQYGEMQICYSGLDRVDSSRGYVHGNVVPCCGECNYAKQDLSVDDFLASVARIQAHNPTAEKIHLLASTLFDSSSSIPS